jgi:TolB-like protein/DNA-binding winged helix-turn-helix (wHTH) protein/tetratricopeptide (TPR) repeat protein
MEGNSTSKPSLRFGPFEVDFGAGELRKHGVKLKLVGQPLEILGMLLEHRGKVVTREELRTKLWPADTFVDFDSGLNAAVNKLRVALSDSAENPKYIETLPRRGYRFIGTLEPLDAPSWKPAEQPSPAHSQPSAEMSAATGPGRRSHRGVFLAALVLLGVLGVVFSFNLGGVRRTLFAKPAAAKLQSIAVLPLENLSSDPEQEYFADGMTDELITKLAQISALKVISRTSSMRYKKTSKSLAEIARELHVDGVVEGTVIQVGGRVRISTQLIEARTDHHLWARSYERDLRDVLSIQDEVTREIAGEVRVKLTAGEQERLVEARPVNPEAYLLYLKGRYFWNKRTEDGTQTAIENFQAAIEKDKAYAPAYAGLAGCYTAESIFGWRSPAEVIPKAKAAALKALEVGGSFAEAEATVGLINFQYEWDWAAAEKRFERALVQDPASVDAHFFYSLYLSARGRANEAEAEAKRQLDLDPVSPVAVFQRAVQLYRARRFDEAIEAGQAGVKLDPNFPLNHWLLGEAYLAKQMRAEGLVEYEKYAEVSHGSTRALGYLGQALGRSGDQRKAEQILSRLKTLSKQRYVSPYYFALVYAGLGQSEQALSWLERACDEHSGHVVFLKVEAEWDPLRQDPRFVGLVQRIGL